MLYTSFSLGGGLFVFDCDGLLVEVCSFCDLFAVVAIRFGSCLLRFGMGYMVCFRFVCGFMLWVALVGRCFGFVIWVWLFVIC